MTEHTMAFAEPAPQPARRRPWGAVAVIASVVAVVLIATAGFAAWRFFLGAGPRPAEVLPASTFALVTVDLDPSGGQKVEAIKTLRKFPTFREESGLKPDSDPLRRLFDEVQKQGECKEVDYERDVKSWIGQRAGLGGVVLGGKPTPVAALQVSDHDNAEAGFSRLVECAGMDNDDNFGWTLTDDYIVISDSTTHAKTVVAEGEKAPLSDDADFTKWTDEAGGAGIVNLYVGPEAVDVASEELGSDGFDLGGLGRLGGLSGTQEDQSGSADDDAADALAAYKDFRGAAAVLRFADGGIELSMAGSGGKATRGKETVADHVSAMPKDTALLLALAVPPGAFDALDKADPKGSGSDLLSGMLGIDFPADLKTLLGKSLSISLGGDAPDDLSSINGPDDISVGALVRGDSEKIDAVIAKLEASAGSTLEDLQVTKVSKDGKVAFASNMDYADQLLGSGALADDEGFKDAVPHAEDSQMIAYADFDGAWGKALVDTVREGGNDDAAEVAKNLETLRAFGASAWTDGDVTHGLVRISLK